MQPKVAEAIEALQENASRVELCGVDMREDMKHLCKAIGSSSTLAALELARSRLDREALNILAKSLPCSCTLRELDLSYNTFGAEEVKIITSILQKCTMLQYINLRNNNLSTEAIRLLSQILCENRSVKKLSLLHNSIDDDGAELIATMITKNSCLEELNIGDNSIGDRGVQAIALALHQNHTLKTLVLWQNELGVGSYQAIGDMLRQNETLEELDLGGNPTNTFSIGALADSLAENKSLTSLDLYPNELSVDDINRLARSLRYNRSLLYINLYCCKDSKVMVEAASQVEHELRLTKALQNARTRLSCMDELLSAYAISKFLNLPLQGLCTEEISKITRGRAPDIDHPKLRERYDLEAELFYHEISIPKALMATMPVLGSFLNDGLFEEEEEEESASAYMIANQTGFNDDVITPNIYLSGDEAVPTDSGDDETYVYGGQNWSIDSETHTHASLDDQISPQRDRSISEISL